MKDRLPLLAALGLSLIPAAAAAQEWVGNPGYAEGIGIRTGNLELHPSFGAEFGYDSNLYRSAEGEGRGVVDVFKLRLTPSLSLSTLGSARRETAQPPRVAFNGSVFASYQELFAADSDESAVSKQRNVALGANAKLDLFPQGKVGFDLVGAYVRMIEPDGNPDDLERSAFNRDTVRGGAGLTWRPGGGLFEWRLGYSLTFNYFEDSDYQNLQNVRHEVATRGRWRFLPRSALLYEGSYGFTRYKSGSPQNDGDQIAARIAYRGLVTYHLALYGSVGWASSYYEHTGSAPPRQYDSITGNAEVTWFIMPTPSFEAATVASGLSSISLGYARSFGDSYFGTFYQRDRGYLRFNMFLLGAFAGGLEAGVARVAYPDVGPQPSISQLRIDGRVFGEYRFTQTLGVNASFLYDQVSSDRLVTGEDLDYDRWQAYLGVRWFM